MLSRDGRLIFLTMADLRRIKTSFYPRPSGDAPKFRVKLLKELVRKAAPSPTSPLCLLLAFSSIVTRSKFLSLMRPPSLPSLQLVFACFADSTIWRKPKMRLVLASARAFAAFAASPGATQLFAKNTDAV